jgi:hypothetical protein
MGKSSKPQVTTQAGNSVQVMQMPQYVQEAQQNLLGTGQNILSPYLNAGTSGYGVAGFNNDQQTAFQGVRDNYANAMAGGGGIGGADIQKFLNPYTQNVVDTTNQTLRDQNDITLNGIRARTAAASSFGGSGSRGALQESEANRNLGSTMASTTAQLMAAGYDRATATALASKQMDTAARQQAIQGLLSAGSGQQALEQTKLDVPLTALQRLLAITPQQYGNTTMGQSNSTTVAPAPQGPSTLQSLLGLGGSILGMSTGGGLAGATVGGTLFNNLFGNK